MPAFAVAAPAEANTLTRKAAVVRGSVAWPRSRPTRLARLGDQSGQRQQHEQARDTPWSARASGRSPAASRGGSSLPEPVDLVEDAAIGEMLGLRPVPAAEHLVHGEVGTAGKACRLRTCASAGRKWCWAATMPGLPRVEELRSLGRGRVPRRSTTLSTTAATGSARIETEGTTISSRSLPRVCTAGWRRPPRRAARRPGCAGRR